MIISKSLFVDYYISPKLAWWKRNDKSIYKFVCGLDDEEVSQWLIELGQNIENRVWDFFQKKFWVLVTDVFSDNPFYEDSEENESRDEDLLDDKYSEKRRKNIEQTLEAIRRKEPLIYQGAFEYDNLYVRVDYLKLNSSWNYDIIEVKAKNSVRKDKIFEGCKNKNAWELQPEFLADISFQKYVVSKVLTKENLWIVWDVFFAYLNYKYQLWETLNIGELIFLDKIENWTKNITLESEENSKIVTIDDTLFSDAIIEGKIQEIQENLILSKKDFNQKFPFSGSKYMEYFWEERPFWTIYWRGITKPDSVKRFHSEWKINIEDLTTEEISSFESASWWGSAYTFIQNYLRYKKENKPLIDIEAIKTIFTSHTFPICFYDYETVSIPVPYILGTSPFQQVVVQYSLHKVYQDWKIEHFSWIYIGWWENKVEKVSIPKNPLKSELENEKIIQWSHSFFLETFLEDIGVDLDSSTFIVWYKPFESSRNKESWEMYPELARKFEIINNNTFDLMEIFKKGYYFDISFKWSNSIKYILPALIPEMSYEWMSVPNGGIAMKLLDEIISGKLDDPQIKKQSLKDLLLYCGQDSYAMYKIYEKILSKLSL